MVLGHYFTYFGGPGNNKHPKALIVNVAPTYIGSLIYGVFMVRGWGLFRIRRKMYRGTLLSSLPFPLLKDEQGRQWKRHSLSHRLAVPREPGGAHIYR